jgi:hypothetical protein
MSQTNLTNEQVFDLQATFQTALGNPAQVTDIAWANSDAAVIAITVDPNDPSKVLVSAVAPGTAVITVEAKTTSGKIIDGAYNVVVEAAEATLAVFIASEPRLKQ